MPGLVSLGAAPAQRRPTQRRPAQRRSARGPLHSAPLRSGPLRSGPLRSGALRSKSSNVPQPDADDPHCARSADARTRGVAAGRSAQRACERSSDWRRGAAGSPDPEHLPRTGFPDPEHLPRTGFPDPENLPGLPDPENPSSPRWKLHRAPSTRNFARPPRNARRFLAVAPTRAKGRFAGHESSLQLNRLDVLARGEFLGHRDRNAA
jgi:hypothetical protein